MPSLAAGNGIALTKSSATDTLRISVTLNLEALAASGQIYESTAAGIAATAEGDYFFVPGAQEQLDLYRNVAAVAVDQNVSIASEAQVAAAADRAEVAADAAASSAASLTPFITAPAAGTNPARLIAVQFLEADSAGVAVDLPAELSLRELGSDLSGAEIRFRLRFAEHAAGVYTDFAQEAGNGTYLNAAGYAGIREIELVRPGGGATMGYAWIDFPDDASPMGDYFSTKYEYAVGGLNLLRVRRSAATKADTQKQIEDTIIAERAKQPSPFVPTVANEYLRRVVARVSIERGVPGRTYVLRHRTDIVTGTHRTFWYLYDPVLGVQVAQAEVTTAGGWPAQETFFLSNAAQGAVILGKEWLGVSATIWVRPDQYEDGQVDITVVDPADAGIDPRNVLTREEVRDRLRNGKAENILYVNADGTADFLTVQAAAASLLTDPASGRAWYPFSHLATPSNQYEIVVVGAGHVEEWLENVVDQGGGSLAAQGILLWEGVTLRVRHDTRMHTTGGAIYGGPLFDANFGGRVIAPLGARFEQLGEGYVFHRDPGNGLSIAATEGPPVPTWQQVWTIDGGTWYGGPAHDDPIFGCGAADDEDIELRNFRLERDPASLSTEPYYYTHNTAGSVFPGRTVFINCSANDGDTAGVAVTVDKSQVQTTRHGLAFQGCDFAKISEGHAGGGGEPGWVLLGSLPDGAVLTGDLAP